MAIFVVTLVAVTSSPGLALQEPDLYDDARSQLAAGDTASALASLQRLTEAEPDFAPGWGLLGRVLTAKASGVATDFRERRQADKALRRALELDSDNPLYLLTLSQLMRKQQEYWDSRRMLDRAFELLARAELAAAEQAELWYHRGLYYEDEYLDTRHLVFAPTLPVGSNCVVPTFCANFAEPKDFNEHLRNAADLSQFGQDDYERMVEAFRRALAADPTHSGAFRRLAIHFIDRGDYTEAYRLARRYSVHVPESPWGHLTIGLIHQRQGRDSLAEVEFDRGLDLALPGIREHYRDVCSILRKDMAEEYSSRDDLVRRQFEDMLWRKWDPLYLTPENEVRVAHLARVVYADLMFEDPSSGFWGSETERGVIYVRYGPPQQIWQLARDAGREMTPRDARDAATVADAPAIPGGSDPINIGGINAKGKGGGRWIFWNYGWDRPNFIFQKVNLRWRHASHQPDSYAKQLEEERREIQPAGYTTNFAIHDYPAQLARFKGQTDGTVELDLYSEIPTGRLFEGIRADSLEAGIFVFGGPQYQKIVERRLSVAVRSDWQALTYTLPLPSGRYEVSLEARVPGGPAAVRRQHIELDPFPNERLSLSDLVVARSVKPKTRAPTDRRGYTVEVNRRLEFDVEDPLGLYWEVYGLTPDEEGFARYRVTVRVTEAAGRGVVAKVLGALGDLLGFSEDDRAGPELSYDRVYELAGDRVPEYLLLELLGREAGEYLVQVKVTDLLSEDAVEETRAFRVRPP